VLTVGFGVDIAYSPDERGPQPTAWFCVRLERLLPSRAAADHGI
jgi:hypothetical protein